MFGTIDLALFVVAGLLLNITPGPDTMYILGRSATHGRRGGTVAALGIWAGCFVHIFAVALGLSALIAASATAFTLIKWMGAVYLIYVGISMLRMQPAVVEPTPGQRTAALRGVFLQGFLTNVFNPKVALFFLAFLPQFIAPDAPNKVMALLFLGFIFNCNGLLWNLLVAWSAAAIAQEFRRAHRVGLWVNRTIGAIFVGFGVRLAFSEPS